MDSYFLLTFYSTVFWTKLSKSIKYLKECPKNALAEKVFLLRN
jgi:hypothetical protein